MDRIRTIAVAVVLALALAACGGGSSDDKAKDASADGTTTSTTATTAPGGAAGGSSTTAAPGKGGSATGPSSAGGSPTTTAPGGGSSGTTEPPQPPKLTATLKSKCVKPGGTQTLDVDTAPQIPVGYTSTYSDGKSGMDPGYYGGSGQGISDNEGDYTATWTITPTAPAGKVEVKVFAAGNKGVASADLTFEMADAAGKCD